MVARHGPNLFYREYRDAHALLRHPQSPSAGPQAAGFKAWAVGLRRSQNESRAEVPKVETIDGPVKISPLADWTAEQVDEYIRAQRRPSSSALCARLHQHRLRSLHARGRGRGRRARGPLVVGTGCRQRVRHSLLRRRQSAAHSRCAARRGSGKPACIKALYALVHRAFRAPARAPSRQSSKRGCARRREGGTAGWRRGPHTSLEGAGIQQRGSRHQHPAHRIRLRVAFAPRRDRDRGRHFALSRGARRSPVENPEFRRSVRGVPHRSAG